MTNRADTSVRQFSSGYAMTEFDLQIGGVESVQISSYRAEDIRAWWYGGTGKGVPVVLRGDNRHLVPEESEDLRYDTLLIPDYMDYSHMDGTFLLPCERHVRRLMGFQGDSEDG